MVEIEEGYQEIFKEAVAQGTAKIHEEAHQEESHLWRGVVSHKSYEQ
ncbi:MAG: hypothetical protein Q8P42_08860 [Gallionella sp.]|nr:hypothetical protein [Gallionella sp.]